ncbi:MAG: hypothetical protein L6V88_05120 [Anaerotruncus sp.]|nr:MAG: hypothetical protein L6V88_05120 [Anaerotruncus sp.]
MKKRQKGLPSKSSFGTKNGTEGEFSEENFFEYGIKKLVGKVDNRQL